MDSQQPSAPQGERPKTLRITLVRSPLGNTQRHKETVRALGLHRIRQTVEKPDSPGVRGMLAKVAHMVKVEEV